MGDLFNTSFDYWLNVIEKRKKEEERKENLKKYFFKENEKIIDTKKEIKNIILNKDEIGNGF
tara:strand:- start:1046 stop:1231 length:186 start_codon:yes stop_codon:yes gene_type:complete